MEITGLTYMDKKMKSLEEKAIEIYKGIAGAKAKELDGLVLKFNKSLKNISDLKKINKTLKKKMRNILESEEYKLLKNRAAEEKELELPEFESLRIQINDIPAQDLLEEVKDAHQTEIDRINDLGEHSMVGDELDLPIGPISLKPIRKMKLRELIDKKKNTYDYWKEKSVPF